MSSGLRLQRVLAESYLRDGSHDRSKEVAQTVRKFSKARRNIVPSLEGSTYAHGRYRHDLPMHMSVRRKS